MPTPSEPDYSKYLQMILKKKQQFAIISLSVMALMVIVSYALPERYEARSTVFIEKSIINDMVKGIAVAPSIDDKIKVLAYAMKSRTLLLNVLDDLDMNVDRNNPVQVEGVIKGFQQDTDIKLKDKEGLFIISYTDRSPRLARDYVNSLIRTYIEENLSSKREDSFGATKFLSDQITAVKEKLDKAETEVDSFKRSYGTVLASDQGSLLREINDAQQRIEELRLRRGQLEATVKPEVKRHPLQGRLVALQRQVEELRAEYTDSFPEIVRLNAEIDSLKEQIKSQPNVTESMSDSPEHARNVSELRALRQAEQAQRSIISRNRVLLNQVPDARSRLEKLERNKETQKLLYDQLAARHGQSEVSRQMEVQDKATTFRVVDPAVIPMKPVSPNRVKIIALGIVLGLATGFASILMLDYLDRSVKDPDSLKVVGVPVLAVIPKIQNPVEIVLNRKKELRLYVASGACFSLILGILLFESVGSFTLNPDQVKEQITRIKENHLK